MDAPQPPPPPSGPWGDADDASAPRQPPTPGSVEQPPSIKLAVRLMWVGAAMSALSIVLAFLSRDEIRDRIIEDDPSLTSSEVDTGVAAVLGFTVVVGLIAVGLWLWMASANGQGKAWARITATVLGGLNVATTLAGLAMGQSTGIQIPVSLVGVAIAIAILVYLYRPDSNQFFDRMSGRTGY